MFKIGTFCTGIGSPEFALEDTPHELIFGCEIDKYARASYLSRYKPKFMLEDMTKTDFSNPELYTDLVIAGLPCQAFSIAGKRLGELDKRGVLIYNFHDYVKQQQPKAFVLENVKGLKSIDKGEIFKNWQRILGRSVNGKLIEDMHPDSLGYNLHWKVLNTKNFDLPQNRERIFIVGIRADLYDDHQFPKDRELKIRLKDILEENVPEKYYLSDKMLAGLTEHQRRSEELGRGFKFEPKGADAACESCIRANVAKMGPDDNYLKINTSDKLTKFGNSQNHKLSPLEGLSQTISSGHFNQPKILINEATKQGFSIAEEGDSINFSQPGSNTRRGRVGKQIANTLDTACNQAVLQQVGNLYENNADAGRIYNSDNISRTLKSEGGGLGSKTGLYILADPVILQTNMAGQTYEKEYAGTLRAGASLNYQLVRYDYRIRRLTPLECWRLQGYSDEYFYQAKKQAKIKTVRKPDKTGMSDTQLYKQAGNSISTTVIKAVLEPVLIIIGTDVI